MSTAQSGIDGMDGELTAQVAYVEARVPAYRRILELVGAGLDGELGRRLSEVWSPRRFSAPYDRPLLLLASLRFDAIGEGPAHPLWAALAAHVPDVAAVTPDALARAFDPTRARLWGALGRRAVQTNEVSRAVAWLWPARLAPAARPLALCDLGASAGLNLVAEALALAWTLPGGAPLSTVAAPRITRRVGLDRNPLDVSREEDADWLRACIWPGEHERLDRLERAIAASRAAQRGPAAPVLEAIDARAMPARLSTLSAGGVGGELWLAYQTVVREYLGDARAAYLEGMRSWVSSMPPGQALWVELERPDHGATRERPAALIAHARAPDGAALDLVLARCDYHPREVAPEEGAVASLRAALAAASTCP